jgi:hypothetical protein
MDMYAYVGDDPLNKVDPTGNIGIEVSVLGHFGIKIPFLPTSQAYQLSGSVSWTQKDGLQFNSLLTIDLPRKFTHGTFQFGFFGGVGAGIFNGSARTLGGPSGSATLTFPTTSVPVPIGDAVVPVPNIFGPSVGSSVSFSGDPTQVTFSDLIGDGAILEGRGQQSIPLVDILTGHIDRSIEGSTSNTSTPQAINKGNGPDAQDQSNQNGADGSASPSPTSMCKSSETHIFQPC